MVSRFDQQHDERCSQPTECVGLLERSHLVQTANAFQFDFRPQVPDPNRTIAASRGQPLVGRIQIDVQHRPFVTDQLEWFCLLIDVHHFDDRIFGGGRYVLNEFGGIESVAPQMLWITGSNVLSNRPGCMSPQR